MIKKEVVKKLNQCVTPFFSNEGYSPFSTGYETGWKRKMENGDIIYIDLAYIPRAGKSCFQIEPGIIIQIKEIENIYRQITSIKNLDYELALRTLNARLSSIQAFPDGVVKGTGHNRFEWIICSEIDIAEKGLKVIEAVKRIGLPYIEKNANTIQVDKLLNENLESTIIHIGSYPDRIMRGLIAAKLVGRKNLIEIIKYYDAIMSKASPNLQAEYSALKLLLPKIG